MKKRNYQIYDLNLEDLNSFGNIEVIKLKDIFNYINMFQGINITYLSNGSILLTVIKINKQISFYLVYE